MSQTGVWNSFNGIYTYHVKKQQDGWASPFSTRLVAQIEAQNTVTYTFYGGAYEIDQFRVWVDDQWLIDRWEPLKEDELGEQVYTSGTIALEQVPA